MKTGPVLDMWSEDAILEALDSNATESVASWGVWKKMDERIAKQSARRKADQIKQNFLQQIFL